VRELRSSRLITVGSTGLLIVIVGLLAFGEMARRGRYHLDGGRGWDLPAPVSVDTGHSQLPSVRLPHVVVEVVQHLFVAESLVPLIVSPFSNQDTAWVWLGLRPPPQT
jgi:hypothetical protein